jgi:PAS domain-containing protein
MTLMLALLIAALIIAMVANLIRLSSRGNQLHLERDRSNAEIEKMKRDLEALVLDRTAAIRKVNEDLQYETQERMKSEELLLEKAQLLRSVICAAPVALWAIDGKGIFMLYEGKGVADLGFRPGEVVGKSVFDVYKDEPQIVQNCQRALSGESFKTFVNASGRARESWYSPVLDAEGKVQRVIGFSIDRYEEAENKK